METNFKASYQKARAEVLLFDNCDVITTSGCSGTGSTVVCYTNVFGTGGGVTPGWN